MPTPKKGYYTKDGDRVPSVTTIIGRFKDSSALMHWAYKQGLAGVELYEERDKAAHCGTLAHAMVEAYINKQDHMALIKNEEKEISSKALNAFQMFREWQEITKIEIISYYQEIPIVDEDLKYGGTPDAVGRNTNGELVMLDWKTSSGIWPDYLVQLAAYGNLWEKEFGEAIAGYHILRFSKDFPDFNHHYYESLFNEFEYFKLLLQCYAFDKRIKQRCK